MAAVSQAIFLFVVHIQLMMKDLIYVFGGIKAAGETSF